MRKHTEDIKIRGIEDNEINYAKGNTNKGSQCL